MQREGTHPCEMQGPVVVTGAAGFIGSWLIMKLLQQGYVVRATVRDPSNREKVKPLLDLPGASTNLTLWKADLSQKGSFDEVISGSVGVFHVATPMDFHSQDPENEVIKPTIEGMLDIMEACRRAGTVRRIVFTTSAGTLNVQEQQVSVYDESSWSDLDFIRRVKMTGWMYFVSKTLAERAAWDFAKENNIDFISIIPPLVVGPFISTSMPPSLVTGLSLITGNKPHYSILKQIQLVHLDDLCEAHIFLFKHPEAKGRYICSAYDLTIFELAKMIGDRFPEYHIPQKFEGIDNDIQRVHFSSKKLLGLGFEFKYKIEDMLDGAIRTCKEKGFLPLETRQENHHKDRVNTTTIAVGENHHKDQVNTTTIGVGVNHLKDQVNTTTIGVGKNYLKAQVDTITIGVEENHLKDQVNTTTIGVGKNHLKTQVNNTTIGVEENHHMAQVNTTTIGAGENHHKAQVNTTTTIGVGENHHKAQVNNTPFGIGENQNVHVNKNGVLAEA